MPAPSAGSGDPHELERLRRALAEARLESDARAAELRALYTATRQLQQWRADTCLQIERKRTQPLWRALTALRGPGILDAFVPPPLAAGDGIERGALPAAPLCGTRRKGEYLFWNAEGSELLRAPLEFGSTGDVQPTLYCENLIGAGRNPLAALRNILANAAVGTEIWLFEADALNSHAEVATIQHLLLDESEKSRAHAPHGVDGVLLQAVVEDLCHDGRAALVERWTQGNAHSLYHLALLKRIDAPQESASNASHTAAHTAPPPGPGATLVLLHANPFDPGAGGTEQFVLARTRALKLPRAILLYPAGPREIAAAEIAHGDADGRRTHTFLLRSPLPQYTDRHPEAEDLLLWVARQFNVGSAILDHLLNWPLRVPELLRSAGIRYAMVLHDYYVVCPHFNLVDLRTNTLCSTHYGGADCAQGCLAMHFAATLHTPAPRDLATHQARMSGALQHAETLICPDRSVARRVAFALAPDAPRESQIQVIPHGMETRAPESGTDLHPASENGRLRVGLLGHLTSPIKGAHWLQEVMHATAALPIDWHVFGRFEGTLPSDAAATLSVHGSYEQSAIVGLLRDHAIAITLFTSLAEETFSLTLSESFCAGIPAVVPDLGALGNRVKTSGFGWTVPPRETSAVVALLERLSTHPAERRAVAAKLQGFRHLTPLENAAEYKRVLGSMLAAPGLAPLAARSIWLERARKRDAELESAYLASSDERWRLDAACADSRHSTLTIKPARFSRDRRHVLALELTTPRRGRLDIFFESLAAPLGTANQVFRRVLNAGRNRIFIELFDPLLCGPLLMSWNGPSGEFVLHAAELRAVD